MKCNGMIRIWCGFCLLKWNGDKKSERNSAIGNVAKLLTHLYGKPRINENNENHTNRATTNRTADKKLNRIWTTRAKSAKNAKCSKYTHNKWYKKYMYFCIADTVSAISHNMINLISNSTGTVDFKHVIHNLWAQLWRIQRLWWHTIMTIDK